VSGEETAYEFHAVGRHGLFPDRPAMVTALLTPFDAFGEVDHVALAEHVDYLVRSGVDGVLTCGTTGEGAALTDEEVVSITATVVGGGVRVA
jgi:4-hydroxy-tetrahydrodipicolinate synthase